MTSSLLKLQIGPVQEFIAQARSTRDLWSGSFLVSWMMGQFIAGLRDRLGTENVRFIFPSFAANNPLPTVAWLEGNLNTQNDKACKKALLPAIPNRILVELPASFDDKAAKKLVDGVFRYEKGTCWHEVGETCWKFFEDHGHPPSYGLKGAWDDQLSRFWQTTWQRWPWENDVNVLKPLLAQIDNASSQFPSGEIDPWHANYRLLAHRLDARRRTRNFSAARNRPTAEKDALSGIEPAIIGGDWFKALWQEVEQLKTVGIPSAEETERAKRLKTLCHLFRNDDPLSAINLVKRVWHRACLIFSK